MSKTSQDIYRLYQREMSSGLTLKPQSNG